MIEKFEDQINISVEADKQKGLIEGILQKHGIYRISMDQKKYMEIIDKKRSSSEEYDRDTENP